MSNSSPVFEAGRVTPTPATENLSKLTNSELLAVINKHIRDTSRVEKGEIDSDLIPIKGYLIEWFDRVQANKISPELPGIDRLRETVIGRMRRHIIAIGELETLFHQLKLNNQQLNTFMGTSVKTRLDHRIDAMEKLKVLLNFLEILKSLQHIEG